MLLAAFTLTQILSYPFPSAPVRDAKGTAIAYTLDTQGVRALWFARAPGFAPKQLFASGADDGQELSDVAISGDDSHVVYVRGGDHDANWTVPLQPGPASMPAQPQMQVWSVSTAGGAPKLLGDGDAPAITPDGMRVAFVDAAGAVQIAPIDGSVAAKRFFFDSGVDSELQWSPDGPALAFVSTRTDHSFIGIYRNDTTPIEFLAPSTSQDFMPRWSPEGRGVAFIRTPGDGGPPKNPLNWNPQPWQIWIGDAAAGSAHLVWSSGTTARDSLPQSGGGPLLEWVEQRRFCFRCDRDHWLRPAYLNEHSLLFRSERDNWPHLYVVSANGGAARPLTRGNYMVEDASVSPERRWVVYSANTGNMPGDGDRRHVFQVDVADGSTVQLTTDAGSEFEPVALASGFTVFDRATAQQPPLVTLCRPVSMVVRAHAVIRCPALATITWAGDGPSQMPLDAGLLPADFPSSQLVAPQAVSFHAADGVKVFGQLFLPSGGGKHPGIIFVHGGPFRQMLLNWHYMDYYSNAYAVNQYLASRGFAVLSVNYRCGIGYGHDFNFPARWGPTGAAEYQDVVAGARFLQLDPHVDAKRIGIWGGSYGGYLTALALARNSDIFKAGVDFHGVHDWSLDIENPVWGLTNQLKRYQQYDTRAMMKLAWESSPDSAISTWKSPVLLIQGDDDRNVEFHQMVDLVQRLRPAGVAFDEIVIPNEIHGFLRYASWLQADTATVDYFSRQLSNQH